MSILDLRPLACVCIGLSCMTSDDPSERLDPRERLLVGCGGRLATESCPPWPLACGSSGAFSSSDEISYGSDLLEDGIGGAGEAAIGLGDRLGGRCALWVDDGSPGLGADSSGVICRSVSSSSLAGCGSGRKNPNEMSSTW
jgi:hypothetical protein